MVYCFGTGVQLPTAPFVHAPAKTGAFLCPHSPLVHNHCYHRYLQYDWRRGLGEHRIFGPLAPASDKADPGAFSFLWGRVGPNEIYEEDVYVEALADAVGT